MLVKWNVEGFKSIYKREEFSLAPLTLFTGANSSGKSSIIQSILVTAQTFQNPLKNNKVLLNGSLIRLGSFEDILSNGLKGETILGFSLDLEGIYSERLDQSHDSDYYSQPSYHDDDEYYAEDYEIEKPLEINFSFKSTPDESQTKYYPPITKLEIKDFNCTYSAEDSYMKTVIQRSPEKIKQKVDQYHIKYSEMKKESILQYDVSSLEITAKGEKINPDLNAPSILIKGAIAKGFLDMEYFKLDNLNQIIAQIILDYYTNHPETQIKLMNKLIESEETRKIYLSVLKIFINEASKEKILSTNESNIEWINQSLDNARELNHSFKCLELINNVIEYGHNGLPLEHSINQNFKKRFFDIVDKSLYPATQLIPMRNPINLDIDTINEYFRERVKYLGPLREEPKPVYTTTGSINSLDVGNKGEFTSFVLEINKNKKIAYISPSSIEAEQYVINEGTLIEAVNEWIKYLEVGHDIQTIDEGSIGRRLKIQLEENERFVDLTNVGVGVSQVLPILVSSLLAEKYSTLIFEQPELHLHPKVQTRLADFFLTMVHLDKQCIIETHSEHIINRLRYKAITSPKDKVPEETLIYFVEKSQGRSNYRQIRMNEYGNIGKWPKGFFDETESNALSIIKAIQAKKRGR